MIGNPKTGSRLETPVITVSEGGLITAKAGKLSATYQLPTQEGKTVVPINSTAEQTAVAKGRFTTGPVYVQSDPDLIASNIKSGVNLFGVEGSMEGRSAYTEMSLNEVFTKTVSADGKTLTITYPDNFNILNLVGITLGWYESGSGYVVSFPDSILYLAAVAGFTVGPTSSLNASSISAIYGSTTYNDYSCPVYINMAGSDGILITANTTGMSLKIQGSMTSSTGPTLSNPVWTSKMMCFASYLK